MSSSQQAVPFTDQDERKIAIVESFSSSPLFPITREVASKIADEAIAYSELGDAALVQAARAVVANQEAFGQAGEVVRAITANLTKVDKDRKNYTTPLDALKAQIKGVFDIGANKLTQAKTELQSKQNVWMNEERQRREVEAAAARKAAEEHALALAQAQSSLGDSAGADKVLEDASRTVARIEDDAKVRGVGMYGTTTSSRKYVTGEVTAAEFLLQALLQSPGILVTAGLNINDLVEFKQAGLNKLAKALDDAGEKVAGLKIKVEHKASSR